MSSVPSAGFVTPYGLRGALYGTADAIGGSSTAVAIGQFDGVHLGHRALVEEAKRQATGRGAWAGAVTFDRHPMQVLAPEAAPVELTPLDEKVDLLLGAGLDFVVVLQVCSELLATEPSAFVDDVLVASLGATAVVVGANFRFGRGAEGTPDLLRSLGALRGFHVVCSELALHDDVAISSTRIRAAIGSGRLDRAAEMLGPSFARASTGTRQKELR